jgi:hypothetical protein
MVVLVQERASDGAAQPVSDRVVLSGPKRFSVDLSRSAAGVVPIKMPSGTYRIVLRTIRLRGGQTRTFDQFGNAEITVDPGSVVLPRWSFGRIADTGAVSRGGLVQTKAADRRRAAEMLSTYVLTAEWAGRRVIGFAPYSPFADLTTEKFRVEVKTTPPGATLTVDGQDWGKTPLPAHLGPGKHFVQLSLDGYESEHAFIEVAAAGTEHFNLRPRPKSSPLANAGKLKVLMEPFANLGSEKDAYLGNVFKDSLSVALENGGIATTSGESGSGAVTSRAGPDFQAAEKAGAQALIAGDFAATDKSILIHAALYDTRTRLVKASVIFEGRAGLAVFDSIDRMSARFGTSVEKVLPEVGQAVVQERVLSADNVGFSARLSEQDIIRQRNRHSFALTIGPYLGGAFDQVTDPANPTNTNSRANGPGFGLDAGFEFPLADSLAFRLSLAPGFFQDSTKAFKLDLPFNLGPQYVFSGYRSDVYFGLLGNFHVVQASTVDFGGGSSGVFGPYFIAGLNLTTGLRLYTYRRVTEFPRFLGFGLTLGLFGYRFDVNFTNPAPYPMELGLHAYWGTRL